MNTNSFLRNDFGEIKPITEVVSVYKHNGIEPYSDMGNFKFITAHKRKCGFFKQLWNKESEEYIPNTYVIKIGFTIYTITGNIVKDFIKRNCYDEEDLTCFGFDKFVSLSCIEYDDDKKSLLIRPFVYIKFRDGSTKRIAFDSIKEAEKYESSLLAYLEKALHHNQ